MFFIDKPICYEVENTFFISNINVRKYFKNCLNYC